MFSLPWSKKQSKDEVVAIIHIGSNMVSGGLVMLHAGAKRHTCATILMAETISLDINPKRLTLKYFLPKLFSSLDQLINKILKAESNFGQPKRVYFFLPSLLVSTQNRLTRLASKEGIEVSRSLIEGLALEESDKLLAEQPNLFPELMGDKSVILESEIVSVKADGYNLDVEVSGKAKELEITTRLVLTSRDIIRQLKERARRLKPTADYIDLRTFVSAAANVFTSIGEKNNFVVLDSVGILTDFIVVKGGAIVAEGSFPIGQNNLITYVAKNLNTTKNEALSTIKLIQSGNLSTKFGKIFEQAIGNFKKDWLTSLKKALGESLQGDFLPETIFINGGGAADNIFTDWLIHDGLGELTISRRGPEIVTITPSLWSSWCLVPQTIRALPALSIESVFCDKTRSGI